MAVSLFCSALFVLSLATPSDGMRQAGSSDAYRYSDKETVIGQLEEYRIEEGESLIEIARKFNLGFNEIIDANPGLDPFTPPAGVAVRIPAFWIVPDHDRDDDIVINLSELRLYYFFRRNGASFVRTFPIGIGEEGTDTPEGISRVIEKTDDPPWIPPESIRREQPDLPLVVPPGPDNPLGSHAMRLSSGNILIHGTNQPWAIGRRASHGCIRLYPEHIPELFRLVAPGAKVRIVRQPVKIGMRGNSVYVEVHRDGNDEGNNPYSAAVRLLIKKNLIRKVDTGRLYPAILRETGIPAIVSP